MNKKESNSLVSTADKIFDILSVIHEKESARLTEIATELDLATSTVHDHLRTMVEKEYLVKDQNEYRLGLKFLNHGFRVRERHPLYQHGRDSMHQIASETDEIVWLVTEEYGCGVYLAKAMGERAVQPYGKIGERVDLHDIAAGKAILAHLPEERLTRIISSSDLQKKTEHTITDVNELKAELDEIRDRGVAFNDEETIERFRAVAAPILPEGELKGAIVVSGPKKRLKGDRFREELPDLISGSANAIELSILSS